LNHMYSVLTNSRVLPAVPMFTQDDKNNIRMTKIINHEFVCAPFIETVNYKYMPLASDHVSTVCDVSIPPSFGHFKGIVEIFLKSPPNDLEKDMIRIMGKEVSARIFEDIK